YQQSDKAEQLPDQHDYTSASYDMPENAAYFSRSNIDYFHYYPW
ncbi:hypothetical protein GTGU_04815, partial [Trabulsiella guamensis ATCC 49490]